MHDNFGIEILFLLLLLVALFAIIGNRLKLPLPILMTMGGLGLSVMPYFPQLTLDPKMVFLLILPPLLYNAGSNTSWRDFKGQLRAILLLAIGLVVATTFCVAWAAMQIIPGMTWPLAILLGAIIAPPDAVAATAVAQKLNLPKRIVTILEGESLVNDATGLVIYKLALAVILFSGDWSWAAITQDFMIVSVGGIIIGLLIGWSAVQLRKPIDNPPVEIILSLLTPFAAYIPAEELGFSGILSVVVCGLYVGWHLPHITSSKSRMVGYTVWGTVTFILNNLVFLLIGLQLPQIISGVKNHNPTDLAYYCAILTATMIVIRMAWVYPGAYLPRLLSSKIRGREKMPRVNGVTFVGWAGMRGVVSLAAAMAIPVLMSDGSPFPQRELITFLCFAMIIFSLLVQGLSLEKVAKWLGIKGDNRESEEEWMAREYILQKAIDQIRFHRDKNSHHPTILNAIEGNYKMKLESLGPIIKQDPETLVCVDSHHDLQMQLIDLQRKALLELRHHQQIGDDVMRHIIRELDLEELQHQSMRHNPQS